jgi:outer membrane protein OmpA-like peptidoglycan-associated protein
MKLSVVLLSLALVSGVSAQEKNPTQSNTTATPSTGNPIFRVQVVSRTVKAVSYRNRSGWTKVDFEGTALAPKAKGKAEINSRKGYIEVKTEVKDLPPASQYGTEYLTYVLWAVTPDGRPKNLGELLINQDGNADIDVTTDLQSFGLIVTAEPYFSVTQPSDVVVMQNVIRQDTVGKYEEVDAKYELMPRGMYTSNLAANARTPIQMDKDVPLELYEARNAIMLARGAGADQYGGETFQNAVTLLNQAEGYQARKAGRKPVTMTAREAVQKAEDSRLIAIRRQRELALQREREEAAAREAQSKAAAEEAGRQSQVDEQRRAEAERQKAQADQQRLQAEQAKLEADAARAQAAAEAQKAQQAANEAERMRAQAEAEKNQIRQQMLTQLNSVLQTRETARGLIMNMSDVLFDFGKYSLKPEAREKLAKVSGIIMAHPGLNLQVEGYTDNVGSDEYNQKLSEQRAAAVQSYLVTQGIPGDIVSAKGLGKSDPVASNDTAQGRQQNRRVQIVVSGDAIGTKVGQMRDDVNGQSAPPPPAGSPAAPAQPAAPANPAPAQAPPTTPQ